jgi:hypothetical protein
MSDCSGLSTSPRAVLLSPSSGENLAPGALLDHLAVPVIVTLCGTGLVEGNFVARASRIGIQVSLLPEELEGGPPAIETVVRRNHLEGNGDGVFVQTTALGTLLEGNHALGSDDDGIDVDSPDTRLVGNHAVHNGDLGIEAVFGVTDGGRNKAHGNGNPAQCTNVDC